MPSAIIVDARSLTCAVSSLFASHRVLTIMRSSLTWKRFAISALFSYFLFSFHIILPSVLGNQSLPPVLISRSFCGLPLLLHCAIYWLALLLPPGQAIVISFYRTPHVISNCHSSLPANFVSNPSTHHTSLRCALHYAGLIGALGLHSHCFEAICKNTSAT